MMNFGLSFGGFNTQSQVNYSTRPETTGSIALNPNKDVETAGAIASLFSPAPVETAGTIASSSPSPASTGAVTSCSFSCMA